VEGSVPVTSPADPPAVSGTVVQRSPTELEISFDAPAAGLLTIRNAYEAGWRATADGRPVATLPVDGFLQGVVLPSETGEVVLTYHDDAVMLGLVLGAGIWSVLLAAPLLALGLERRTRRRALDAG
jgi:uncharacterized membrane protein YfhO